MRGRPAVAYDQQGLVFSVAMEGGAIKLFDVRSYDKVSNSLDVSNRCTICLNDLFNVPLPLFLLVIPVLLVHCVLGCLMDP